MVKSKHKLLGSLPLPSVSQREGHPCMLLDGYLRTSHNTLINIAIGVAANEVFNVNVSYLCSKEKPDHYSDRLFKAAGIPPTEVAPYRTKTSNISKLAARAEGYARGLFNKQSLLNFEKDGVPIGDLIYDSIVRSNSGVYTLQDYPRRSRSQVIERAIRRKWLFDRVFESIDVSHLVLSHKVYTGFGIPARVATDHDVTFVSKSRAHLNRVDSLKGHRENDYVLSLKEMDDVAERVGEKKLFDYASDRFEGNVDGTDVEFAFADKKGYDAEILRSKLGATDTPLAVIAPHAFSDAPHCDRDMVYGDYYLWFVRLLELTKKVKDVRWAVKPHPSSSMYSEEGVVESIVQRHDHVQLVPTDVRTDSVLQAADAILTVRGTIGMEALLFDCQVILAGNAIYESIDSMNLNLSEDDLREAIHSIRRKTTVPDQDKIRALAALYYRNESYNYVSPLFGPERPPGFSQEEAEAHDWKNIESLHAYLENNSYKEDSYYQALVKFFETGDKRLAIHDLIPSTEKI